MQIKLGTATSFYFLLTPGDAINVPNYAVFKNGGGGGAGAGTIGIVAACGNGTLMGVNLAAADVDTLGQLYIVVNQAGVNWAVELDVQIVPDVPGSTVQTVLGNVEGNLVGDLLGSMVPAMRLQIASAVLTQVDGVESGLTLRQATQGMFAVLACLAAKSPGQVDFQNFGQTLVRVQVTFDADGNRTGVAYNFS